MNTALQEYGKFLDDTSWYTHTDEGNAPELAYLTLGLAGETGEFADAVKKIIRVTGMRDMSSFIIQLRSNEPTSQVELINELGDVLWYLVKLSSFLGYTIEQLAAQNTFKLYERLTDAGKITSDGTPWPFSDKNLQRDQVSCWLESLPDVP